MYFNKTRKPFSIDGVAKDQETIIRLRQELESRLEDNMRAKGYVPSLDVTPELYWDYNKEADSFRYVVIIYGIYVGKKKSQYILGLLGPHAIYKEPYSGG